jgi:hypothetical protein
VVYSISCRGEYRLEPIVIHLVCVAPLAELTLKHSRQLHIHLWKENQYIAAGEDGPEPLIDLQHIISLVVRYTATIGSEHVWATIPLRVSPQSSQYCDNAQR